MSTQHKVDTQKHVDISQNCNVLGESTLKFEYYISMKCSGNKSKPIPNKIYEVTSKSL